MKKIKKSTIIKILIVIIVSLILTICFGPVPQKYFHDFTNPNNIYISPYEDPANEESVKKLNSFASSTLKPSMKHQRDYFILNGGGNTIVGTTRVYQMDKEDFRDVTFDDYITWTEHNFVTYECKTQEELNKNIVCGIKGYILFDDNTAIKYLDGKSDYITVTKIDFKYLNGFTQQVIQERRSRENVEKPSFFYVNKELFKDYSVIDKYEMDNEEKFEEFKNYIFKK